MSGKESVKVFGTPEAAEEHAKTIATERKRHGRAAAVNSDEISALALWRDFVAGEHTAGRDTPALRDVLKQAIGRVKDGIGTPALDELRKTFLDSREREELSGYHVNALKSRLKRFVSYFPKDEEAGVITTEAVERVMASMRAAGLSAQTVKGTRGAAHGMFSWALDRNLITSNPVTRAKAPKVTQGEVGTLTPSQLGVLLRTALRSHPRAVPALALAAFCGVRRAELCRLRFEDMDIARAELRISAAVAKTGVARFIPMPPALLAWLEAATAAGVAPLGKLLPDVKAPGKSRSTTGADQERKPSPAVCEARSEALFNNLLLDVRKEAGLTVWPTNALRHSFASHACAMHDDFSKVAAWLGHARDPRLLVTRYRHAVKKDDGEKWFNVFPDGYAPPKAKRKSNSKTA